MTKETEMATAPSHHIPRPGDLYKGRVDCVPALHSCGIKASKKLEDTRPLVSFRVSSSLDTSSKSLFGRQEHPPGSKVSHGPLSGNSRQRARALVMAGERPQGQGPTGPCSTHATRLRAARLLQEGPLHRASLLLPREVTRVQMPLMKL